MTEEGSGGKRGMGRGAREGDTESPLVLIWCVFPLKPPAFLSEFCSFSKQTILFVTESR